MADNGNKSFSSKKKQKTNQTATQQYPRSSSPDPYAAKRLKSQNDSNPSGVGKWYVWRKSFEWDVANLSQKKLYGDSIKYKPLPGEGRGKPLDVLVSYLKCSNESSEVASLPEPWSILWGLTYHELQNLRRDIQQLQLDSVQGTQAAEFWEALSIVCEWEMGEAKNKYYVSRAHEFNEPFPSGFVEEETARCSQVDIEVRRLLERLSPNDLSSVESCIEYVLGSGKLESVASWEAALQLDSGQLQSVEILKVFLRRVRLCKAKICLNEIHAKKLGKPLPCGKRPVENKGVKDEYMEKEAIMFKHVEQLLAIEKRKMDDEGAHTHRVEWLDSQQTGDQLEDFYDAQMHLARATFWVRFPKLGKIKKKSSSVLPHKDAP